MTNANDPAFTGPTDKGFTPGLTKREYMATQILAGMFADRSYSGIDDYNTCVHALMVTDILIRLLNESNDGGNS